MVTGTIAPKFLVSGIHTITEYPPIALGMCMAYARQVFSDDAHIEISREMVSSEQQLIKLIGESAVTNRRHILLFSNYLWNREVNLRLSRIVKRLAPESITIHGGPDTPAYPDAARQFLAAEPHVDFIVAGEGEETLRELLLVLTSEHTGRIDVDGLRYMHDGVFVETPLRLRTKDINKFPSPYLSGFFDNEDVTQWQSVTIETYRGCPYGCTFCDWGSNIASKIRMFDIQRVLAEIEWVSQRKVNILWIADSNFGISDRDLGITRKVCEVKRQLGYPKAMVLTFAKNIKSRVVDIVQLMTNEGLLSNGTISLQTMDPETLRIVRRSNIKTSEYENLRNAFVARDLPLSVELMMALPGSTLESFKHDLLYHFDMPIEVFVHRTMMLTNSPMADPNYRREHRIEVDEESRVTQTATMSAVDIETASVICRLFYGVHRFGILRYLIRWWQWEKRISPLDVLHDLVRDAEGLSDYPQLAALVRDAHVGSPIAELTLLTAVVSFREQQRLEASWAELSKQFIGWVSRRHGFSNDEALHELGRIQARLMPAAGRHFPGDVIMRHDVLRWYADWLDGRGAPLSEYGAGILRVDDPFDLSEHPCHESIYRTVGHAWELEHPLLKVRRAHAKKMAMRNNHNERMPNFLIDTPEP